MERNIDIILDSIGAKHKQQTIPDVVAAIRQFPNLTVHEDSLTFQNGCRKAVLLLRGTLPVFIGGSTYNIPISIYILNTYPENAPICYVRPTSSMIIKPSANVDHSGLVYLPYLSDWKRVHSDLIGLLSVMTIVFGEQCPVFTRISRPAAQPTAHGAPLGFQGSTNLAYRVPLMGANDARIGNANTKSKYPPYPTDTVSSTARPPYPVPVATTGLSNTIKPEHIRDSLISAAEDMMRKKLFENISTLWGEVEFLKRTNEELKVGSGEIKNKLTQIKVEMDKLNSSKVWYEEKIEELDKVLRTTNAEDNLPPDEVIDTTTPLYRQLVHCYSEDCAIDDVLYYLSEAIKKGSLEMDQYLKHVRRLSRRQFMLRATMEKCRQVAGLAPV